MFSPNPFSGGESAALPTVVSDFVFGVTAGIALLALLLGLGGWALWYRRRHTIYTEEELKRIIDQRLDSSRNKLKGDIGKQIAPHMREFIDKYDPADARYLGGKPVDYIVYKGYSRTYNTDEPIDVVFVEIKTSKQTKRRLDKNDSKIKDAIDSKRVRHDVITLQYA